MNVLIIPPRNPVIIAIGSLLSWLAFFAASCDFCVMSVGSSMRSMLVSQRYWG